MESPKRIGDYILLEKIGKGGQASVWKGMTLDNQVVAIKKMAFGNNPDNKKSYEREVAIQKLVQHENLVKNLACFQEGQYYYLVYEHCPCDLLQFLQKQPNLRFPEPVVKKWIRQLTSVMIKLNSLKIVHRDLKPENILLTAESMDADIRLADFGLAKQGLTTLSFVGTLEYASPEIKNCQDYSFNTDVWSLGVIAYAALLGKLPILDTNRRLKFPPDSNALLSDMAMNFLETCMIFDFRQRPEFQQLILHPFLMEEVQQIEPVMEVEQPVERIGLKPRTIEDLQKYSTKIITLCDDLLSFVSQYSLEFLNFFVAKYFMGKFQEIITYIFETSHIGGFNPVFMEYFFNESEKACNIYNSMEKNYRTQTADDMSTYSMVIEEIISTTHASVPRPYLKILQKIDDSMKSPNIVH